MIEENNQLLSYDENVSLIRVTLLHSRGLANIPDLVAMLIKEHMWQKRIIQETGQVVEFTDFRAFVEAKPLEGLGIEYNILKRICQNTEAEQLMLELSGELSPYSTNIDTTSLVHPTSNYREYIIAQLKHDYPEIAERILTGDITVSEGARQAGFKPRTTTIYPDNVERTAKVIRKAFTVEEQVELIRLLVQ